MVGVSSIDLLSPQEAEIKAKLAGHPIDSIWLVGGSVLYSRAMETLAATHIYLTRIHKTFDCDTFFPEIDFKNYIEVRQRELECFQLTFISSLANMSCTTTITCLFQVRDPAVDMEAQSEGDIFYHFKVYERKDVGLLSKNAL